MDLCCNVLRDDDNEIEGSDDILSGNDGDHDSHDEHYVLSCTTEKTRRYNDDNDTRRQRVSIPQCRGVTRLFVMVVTIVSLILVINISQEIVILSNTRATTTSTTTATFHIYQPRSTFPTNSSTFSKGFEATRDHGSSDDDDDNDDDDSSSTERNVTVTVYHIGQDAPYGRTNNRLISILHATDHVFEYHRAHNHNNIDNSDDEQQDVHADTSVAVVAVWGWASKVLREMFAADDVNNNQNHQIPWPIQLECMFLMDQHYMNRDGYDTNTGSKSNKTLAFHNCETAMNNNNSSNDNNQKTTESNLNYKHLPIIIHGSRLSAWKLEERDDVDSDNHHFKHSSRKSKTTKGPSNVQHIYLKTKNTYLSKLVGKDVARSLGNNSSTSSSSIAKLIEQRRRHVLRPLFQNIPQRYRLEYNALQSSLHHWRSQFRGGLNVTSDLLRRRRRQKQQHSDGGNKDMPYIAIHSRWLEGQCENFLGPLLPHDECYMSPRYIKRLLELLTSLPKSSNDVDHMTPIVIVGDGQRPQVVTNLLADADIGPRLIVAPDSLTTTKLSSQWRQPISDMIVAIHSAVFIGTRASTMATMIGQVRVVLNDFDPSTNLLFVHHGDDDQYDTAKNGHHGSVANKTDGQRTRLVKNHSDNFTIKEEPEQRLSSLDSISDLPALKVCGECIFWCNETESNICGRINLHN